MEKWNDLKIDLSMPKEPKSVLPILMNEIFYLHSSERTDGDRHSHVWWRLVFRALTNQDMHGSGDRRRSFPGGYSI